MSEKLPGDGPIPHNPKNDLPAERRLPTSENLRHAVRSACRQIDNVREQCELRLNLRGQRVVHDELFLTSFAHTVAVAMHTGWRGDCQVLVVVIPRNATRFQARTTIESIELRASVVAKVLELSKAPYWPVPLNAAPLESLLVLIPAGQAEPQWATSISDPARLQSILRSLLAEYRGLGGGILVVPADGMPMWATHSGNGGAGAACREQRAAAPALFVLFCGGVRSPEDVCFPTANGSAIQRATSSGASSGRTRPRSR